MTLSILLSKTRSNPCGKLFLRPTDTAPRNSHARCESLTLTRRFSLIESHSRVIILYCSAGTEARMVFQDSYRKLSRVSRALTSFHSFGSDRQPDSRPRCGVLCLCCVLRQRWIFGGVLVLTSIKIGISKQSYLLLLDRCDTSRNSIR